jgi:hypothetical protein
MLENGFPKIWTLEFLKIHNTIITSSILIETELCKQKFPLFTKPPPGEDYDAWLSLLEYTNSVYVPDVCFYYDEGHGDGQNY